MKRCVILAVLTTLFTCSTTDARVKTIGQGAKINFSAEGISEIYKPSFDLMEEKCVKCHSMERTVIAIMTGKGPITGQPFNKQAIKAYGIKMLRKPNSDMNKREIRDIVLLLNYLLDENAK